MHAPRSALVVACLQSGMSTNSAVTSVLILRCMGNVKLLDLNCTEWGSIIESSSAQWARSRALLHFR